MYVRCRAIDLELQARRGRRTSTGNDMSKLRARPRSCKRTRRMAAPPVAQGSIFISTDDWNDGCLVYGVEAVAPPPFAGPVPPAMEIRPSAEPVVRWREEEHKLSALVAVSGSIILAVVNGSRRTVIRDAAARTDAPGPRLHRSKRDPAMLPVGDGATVLVMDTSLRRPGRCCFEMLRRLPGGDWRADALPDPPVEFLDEDRISCYFTIASRTWITVRNKGTLSLDTETGTWRTEGTWELPLKDRGFFVPELGVVIGIPRRGLFVDPPDRSERCCQVCAIDVEARPPVIRHVFEIPPERLEDVPRREVVSLASLGNGRFCVARSLNLEVLTDEGWLSGEKGTSFTLVDISRLPGGELELAKHGKAHCHVWPTGHTGNALFLQPA